MQHQKRGENIVKPPKQTDTVEVASSNLALPTMKNQGVTVLAVILFYFFFDRIDKIFWMF
jgi:hypothetical protein